MKDELRQAMRHPGWRAVVVAAVLAVAVTAMFGGFRTAKARRTYPEYGANATIDNGAIALTPLRAWIYDVRPGSKPNPYVPPAQYLVLQLRAENRTGSSLAANSYLQSDVVWLRQVPGEGEKAAAQQRSEGHDFGFELPPRLPVDVDLVWKLPPETELPSRLTWGVLAREYIAETYLTGESGWVQQGPLAKLVLEVEDRRAGAAR
jgi:hypothetical protein